MPYWRAPGPRWYPTVGERLKALAPGVRDELYQTLARGSGTFAMLALDQRGSLEAMFLGAQVPADVAALDAFRTLVRRTLSPYASAVLLDAGYLGRLRFPEPPAPAGLIVAADELHQRPGEAVQGSDLDPSAAPLAVGLSASALKLLVIWRAGDQDQPGPDLVARFVDLAHKHQLLAVVEVIVRAADDGTPTAEELLRAAEVLSREADIYKAQVPIHRGESTADVEALGREMTATVPCPWVVLSTGVDADRFPTLTAAACRAGASGFLAGRAIWADAIGRPDVPAHLSSMSVDRLRRLSAIVDAEGRPFREATRDRPGGEATASAAGDRRSP